MNEKRRFPGCAADGKAYKEALSSVEVVIQEWIETANQLGRLIPVPRGRLAFACSGTSAIKAPSAELQ